MILQSKSSLHWPSSPAHIVGLLLQTKQIHFCAQIAQGIWDVPGCSRMSLLQCTNMIQYDPMVCMFFPTGFGGYVAGAKHSSQPEAWKQCEKCPLRIVAILMVPFPGVKPIFDVLKPSVLFDTCRKSPTGFALLGVNYQQLLIGLFGSIWSLCLCSEGETWGKSF